MSENEEEGVGGHVHLAEVHGRNFMGVKLFTLELEGGGQLIPIGGKNGMGKSSAMRIVDTALQGKRFHPDMPLRKGSLKGEVAISTTNGLHVERRWTAKGGGSGSLKVTRGDAKVGNPQDMLNELWSEITFNPLAFSEMSPDARLEMVKQISGIDTEALEQAIASAVEDRKEANATVKRLRGVVASLPSPVDDIPEEEVSLVDLICEQDDALAAREQNADKHRLLAEAKEERVRIYDARTSHREEAQKAQEEVERWQKRLRDCECAITSCDDRFSAQESVVQECQGVVDSLEEPDVESIQTRMTTLESTNVLVRQNAEIREKKTALKQADIVAKDLDEKVDEAREAKREAVAASDLPVEGMEFDETGVFLDGVPFEQVNTKERLEVGFLLGVAMNPDLRIMLIPNGSVLDDEAIARLAELAVEYDFQVFIERVGHDDPGVIVMQDGEVVEEGFDEIPDDDVPEDEVP